jgi:hypothetical protein
MTVSPTAACVPSCRATSQSVVIGLYVFLVGTQVGLVPTDDVRLLTEVCAAVGGGAYLTIFNRRLQQAREIQAKVNEDEVVRRITVAARGELQP